MPGLRGFMLLGRMMKKAVKMIPFKRVRMQGLFQQVGIVLGSLGNNPGSLRSIGCLDRYRLGQGDTVAIDPGAKGKKNENRGAGDQGKDKRGLRNRGNAIEKVDGKVTLIRSPDDIPGHGHQPAGLQQADSLDCGKRGRMRLIRPDDGHPGPLQFLLLGPLHPLLFLDTHIEQQLQILPLFHEEPSRHLPVPQMGHQQDRASLAEPGIQLFLTMTGEHRCTALVAEEAVEMNGRKILVLFEGAPEVISCAPVGKEGGIEPSAFLDSGGEEKITNGNAPGNQGKNPGAEYAGDPHQKGVVIDLHRR